MPHMLSFTNEGVWELIYQPDIESPNMEIIPWDDDIVTALLISLGSAELWRQVYPGVGVPQEILDAEAARLLEI